MSNDNREISNPTAVSVAFLQHATPVLLRALEAEVPAMVASGPDACKELGGAIDSLRSLDEALRSFSVEGAEAPSSAATLDSVSGALKEIRSEELPDPLRSAVKDALAGVELLAKFAIPAPATGGGGNDLLKAALALIPEGDLIAGYDETWTVALELGPEKATAFLCFDELPSIEEILPALAKRGAPWLIDVENCAENREWLSLLSRVFQVKSWPRANRILACSFDPATPVEWLDADVRLGRIVKAESKKDERFVLGVVLEPETVDSQKDIYSAAEIRSAAHKFMEQFGNIGLQHKVRANEKVKVLESYVAPCDFKVGDQEIKAGTWMMACRVLDDELWKAVKKGTFTGYSIGGTAIRRPERNATS